MRTADFHFHLPADLIAQQPAPRRDDSRLLVLTRETGLINHCKFHNLVGFLRPGDVLVLNNSRVIPARLRGANANTGGAFEILLLEENATNDWWVMLKPGKRARIGTRIHIAGSSPGRKQADSNLPETLLSAPQPITATVVETNAEGHRRLQFSGTSNILDELYSIGEVPLPPYIQRDSNASLGRNAVHTHSEDLDRYQTVFAKPPGSVAAPTAGLHFTPELLETVRANGVDIQFVTLHVGFGTFAPVKTETLDAHVMHAERYEVTAATARAVNAAKSEHRRIIVVGTTSLRVLESAAIEPGRIAAGLGRTNIFIHPPYHFKIADALLTNFHLPCSTLLMLVSAFAAPGETRGREIILSAYAEAIRERYRFFSYGDAMLIV